MNTCGMCHHEAHDTDDCDAVTGYDHLNGDHECGCPGVDMCHACDRPRGTAITHRCDPYGLDAYCKDCGWALPADDTDEQALLMHVHLSVTFNDMVAS